MESTRSTWVAQKIPGSMGHRDLVMDRQERMQRDTACGDNLQCGLWALEGSAYLFCWSQKTSVVGFGGHPVSVTT